MKIGFSTLSCPAWTLEQTIKAALEFGYTGVELRLLDGEVLDPLQDRQKIIDAVAAFRAAKIEVCCLDTSCRLNQPDEEQQNQMLTELRAWIALAQEVEVPLLRVFGGMTPTNITPTPTEEQEDERVLSSFQHITPDAEAANVTIALETHDAFSSSRRIARILAKVPSPNIGVIWDSHHPFRVGETAEEVYQNLGPRIVHTHVKDAVQTTEGTWDLVLLGDGEVPVEEMLIQLKTHGYNGWVVVEWEKKWHPEIPDPEFALPQHMSYLSTLLPALDTLR
ncbi:fatty-acyl-CoA synthase [Thermosporothrix hazakensis]|jgi:fatty-acyl-CoA synthase|uniref:Fatty-acyl-CoA synthase n=2 Tax=Thermosporothrix TaxID=768650 RepID=A0A326U626_THEHA|nr:sugar phosphate isomerase/epimerase [Thermosporothrix hazakensis]PZW29426.1 fatty-acyl-CoA synthase [Thermosporothrix hazakensis]BBH85712.1 sugar phosphate isomerase [Thermosporothrix sp. COM3]GCE45859.1 sugar phosphate isomerase [Thermosporothrix hazakensis]